MAGEELAAEVSGEEPQQNPFLILARLRYQMRIASSSTAAVVNNEMQRLNMESSGG